MVSSEKEMKKVDVSLKNAVHFSSTRANTSLSVFFMEFRSHTVVCDVTFLDVRSLGDMHTVMSGQGQMGHLQLGGGQKSWCADRRITEDG